jgi:hypothetical protein
VEFLRIVCRNSKKFRRGGCKVDHIVTSYLIFYNKKI